jgi:hypothetical protein
MQSSIQFKRTTLLFFIPLSLACFALLPQIQAVSPTPDGGYAGNNTAEGTDALFSLTSGTENTANGLHALFTNITGSFNTAVGDFALQNNTTASFKHGQRFSSAL